MKNWVKMMGDEKSVRREVALICCGDTELWYLDGKYVGHDDQIDITDLMRWLGGEILTPTKALTSVPSLSTTPLAEMRLLLGLECMP